MKELVENSSLANMYLKLESVAGSGSTKAV